MSSITVIKRDHLGQDKIRYDGEVIGRGANWVCVRAALQSAGGDYGYMQLQHGDIFTEWHYADRWYNIFRIESSQGILKGWYCNFVRPAQIAPQQVAADDLALDLFVTPHGVTLLLDADEYTQLGLTRDERSAVNAALIALRWRVFAADGPFAELG